MFLMIDRTDKEALVYCVMDNRTQENLLDLVKRNVYTINDNLNEYDTFNTSIYSDYFTITIPLQLKKKVINSIM